jgi:hypothetical protein
MANFKIIIFNSIIIIILLAISMINLQNKIKIISKTIKQEISLLRTTDKIDSTIMNNIIIKLLIQEMRKTNITKRQIKIFKIIIRKVNLFYLDNYQIN